ncbi:methylated-DNA--[protein]-cysteine S-methyltransferase [Nissabacter sp. SGAir0207]|uniref:methylated-DNA--[protein]-cysteine S-methyltransferase n=1 Tax=Nissabacter sp. SGAir0207 TaxID=2126321 RepID=UPI0010CD670F|nr:methylated-DNA--[protein]-cysteine S-methyltransferase [Nissabacter sp. SGAir0207]QCR36064.1 methylated-DNA--[protein]-cysteine S-methyltransferase [Nissabacter sp. SGAir0207]
MLTLFMDKLATPLGDLLLVADEQGNLRSVEWLEFKERMDRLLGLHYGRQGVELREARDPHGLTRALADYFDGNLGIIDTLPTATGGTEFQRQVWAALRTIPCGETLSYGALAQRLGRPGASRAVGAANGANPISIVVPCHRVIGSAGVLTGYAGGVTRKAWLLRHEGASLRQNQQQLNLI